MWGPCARAPPPPPPRRIPLGGDAGRESAGPGPFVPNKVITSQYTLLSFLPLVVLRQFYRTAK